MAQWWGRVMTRQTATSASLSVLLAALTPVLTLAPSANAQVPGSLGSGPGCVQKCESQKCISGDLTSQALQKCQASGVTLCTPVTPSYGANQYFPRYLVLSLLYAPPGLQSSAGYSQTNTEGTTISVSSSIGGGFQVSASASGGLIDQATIGTSFQTSLSAQSTSSLQITASSTSGAQVGSSSDAVKHVNDRFFLLLNPVVTITQTGPKSANFTVSTPAGQPMDVIDVSLAEAQNPKSIPTGKMNPQQVHGITLPGLNGLTSNDWSQIVLLDPFAAAPVTASPADTKRFRYVDTEPLEGPDQPGGSAVKYPFNESDGIALTAGQGETISTSVSLSAGAKIDIPGVFTLQVNATTSNLWSWSSSTSASSGKSNQESVTFGTSPVGCLEYVDIYTDLVYHTFVYVTPHPEDCPSTPKPNQMRNQYLLSGVVSDQTGKPLPHELVTIKLTDGSVRRIYTSTHGLYQLYSAVAGAATVGAVGGTKTVVLSASQHASSNFVK